MSIKTDAIVIRDETLAGANTATRVGNNLVAIADDLVAKQVEINANVADITTLQGEQITQDAAIALNTTHRGLTTNPHSVTKAQVGLANVDNTTDLLKPISTATQSALDAKQATLVSGTNIKTINSVSILGTGDITITGGGGLATTDIDTLAELNGIVTDATLLDEGSIQQWDALTHLKPQRWVGTQAQYDIDFPTGHGSREVVILDAVAPELTASDITDFDVEVANNTAVALNTAKISDYEIQVGTGNVDDVQAALDTAGVIPVRITSDIIDLDRPILMNSNQTLIFEGYTIYVKTDVSSGGVDANIFFNGHAVIKNRNGIGLGSVLSEGGDWSGTGLGGETNITVIGGSIVGTGHIAYMYNGVQFHNVTNSRIENVKCVDVLTRTGLAQGNIDLRNSDNIFVKNISSTGTEKSGIWANDCDDLHINGGFITLSGDSGIAGETNERPVIENIIVDNCGLLPAPQGASNVTMDMRNGRFINNTILNASGTTNGYGLTLGHPNPDNAWNTVVSGNHFEGNAVNGIRLQGALTRGITIEGNTFINNGNGSVDSGAGGINFNAVTSSSATNNYFSNNRHGIITSNGATNITINNNTIEDSNQFGINLASGGNFIKNNSLKGNLVVQIYDGGTGNLHIGNTHSDGGAYTTDIQETFTIKKTLPLDANLMTGSLLKLQPSSPNINNAVAGASSGIAMQVDGRSGLYGVTASTFVGTSRTDFDYKIKAHKGTEAGVILLSIDDVGNAAITGTVTATSFIGDGSGLTGITGGGNLSTTDIDTLAELNAIVTDATLIDTTDARLSDARTPLAHTHVAADITDFDTEVANNTAVAANTAKTTNATHTGDVTGATALTIASTAISGKGANAGLVGTEEVLINNAGILEKTTTQAIADLGGGGGASNIPFWHDDINFTAFTGRYYLKRGSYDDAASSFVSTSADNLGTIWALTAPYAGFSIPKATTITNIKLNYSTLYAETYVCYLVVKRFPAGVETNSILWTSANLVTTASSVGSLDVTGLSISLEANDRIFIVTQRTASTEGTNTGIYLSFSMYE